MTRKQAFHLARASFWVAMIPIAITMGWHTSVFLVFLYSTYANVIGDIDAYEATKAQDQQNRAAP